MSVMRFEIARTLAAYFLIGWGTSLNITAITVAVNFSTIMIMLNMENHTAS